MFNVHREHADGQRVTDGEYAAKAKQRKSSSQSSSLSSHTYTPTAASSAEAGASAAAVEVPGLSHADVEQVLSMARATSTNAPGRESKEPPDTVTVPDDSDVESSLDVPTTYSAPASLAATSSAAKKGEPSTTCFSFYIHGHSLTRRCVDFQLAKTCDFQPNLIYSLATSGQK